MNSPHCLVEGVVCVVQGYVWRLWTGEDGVFSSFNETDSLLHIFIAFEGSAVGDGRESAGAMQVGDVQAVKVDFRVLFVLEEVHRLLIRLAD